MRTQACLGADKRIRDYEEHQSVENLMKVQHCTHLLLLEAWTSSLALLHDWYAKQEGTEKKRVFAG